MITLVDLDKYKFFLIKLHKFKTIHTNIKIHILDAVLQYKSKKL